jgi:serine/threonine protein kinase
MRRRVWCPAENTWQEFVGGTLDYVALDHLNDHMDGCSSCQNLYADLARRRTWAPPTAQVSPLRDVARGTSIGRYVVIGALGRGGMGVVYKAFDPELDRTIALKLVGIRGNVESLRQRLLSEAKTLAQLSHPNVVAVHDVGTFEDSVFVAMEFVAGQNLREWLAATSRTPREILDVFSAAGAGLAAAHDHGIVHRDFKPENVMVGVDGRVRVLDFGLAQVSERRAPTSQPIADQDDDLTSASAIMGTPAYMAPEQDLGRHADGRSDQFSFCVALYEALFTQRPFAGSSYGEIARQRLAGAVRPPPSVRGVSARTRRTILYGLRVDSTARHASISKLSDLRHSSSDVGRAWTNACSRRRLTTTDPCTCCSKTALTSALECTVCSTTRPTISTSPRAN